MFDNIATGQTVMLNLAGSTQGLKMRAMYAGEVDGVHSLHGLGVLSGADFHASETADGWALANGRRLLAVEAV